MPNECGEDLDACRWGERDPGLGEARPAVVGFCARCGAHEGGSEEPAGGQVCCVCSFGLVLHASTDVAPKPTEAFLVLDDRLAIGAVSERAEGLLRMTESHLLGAPITDLVIEGGVGTSSARGVEDTIKKVLATSGSLSRQRPQTVAIELRRLPALNVRIGSCGPPRAAVMVLATV